MEKERAERIIESAFAAYGLKPDGGVISREGCLELVEVEMMALVHATVTEFVNLEKESLLPSAASLPPSPGETQ